MSQNTEQSSTNNADAINQLSTAPPGTGPPPTLGEAPDMNAQPTDATQANGIILLVEKIKIAIHNDKNIILFFQQVQHLRL